MSDLRKPSLNVKVISEAVLAGSGPFPWRGEDMKQFADDCLELVEAVWAVQRDGWGEHTRVAVEGAIDFSKRDKTSKWGDSGPNDTREATDERGNASACLNRAVAWIEAWMRDQPDKAMATTRYAEAEEIIRDVNQEPKS